jgi:AmmeMemoRadiSam system protein B
VLRPRLRPVETIVVPDPRHGKVLVLRDTQGIAQGHAVIPPTLIPIVARFTGRLSCAQIAKEVSREIGADVPLSVVETVAEQLDQGLFLEGETFERALGGVRKEFHALAARPASHAGGAYPDERVELAQYIDQKCVRASAKTKSAKKRRRIRALVAPHIDPWRGAVGYGHAYGALSASLEEDDDAGTFVVLGTSHAPMREPFALCNKAYDTPFGPMPADDAFVKELAAASDFDPFADELNHKREHSIEFQAVFLKHVLGKRKARIVPILAGLGDQQSSRKDPRKTAAVAKFLDALREGVAKRNGRVVVVAGADMAHVGPRFGDPEPHDAEKRSALEETDRASLDLATSRDARAFWNHVAADLDERRVCGLAPIFSLVDVIDEKLHGELLHYEQNVDPDDGSIVSFASVAFS